jgi:hypothetical protein
MSYDSVDLVGQEKCSGDPGFIYQLKPLPCEPPVPDLNAHNQKHKAKSAGLLGRDAPLQAPPA